MPMLFYGPGGGGGSGYKYPIGNIISPTIDVNGNDIALKWRDPDDAPLGGGLVEWKGTIVVAKQGSPPMDADDGERVAIVTEKNSHVENALVTDVGGMGYYYGFFPYTKDYVVNNRPENVLIADGGLLEYTPWADIAAASANGTASDKWAIGDEKKITLTGDYAGEHTFAIAGFNHDDLSDGSGKAGITFASKDIVASVANSNNRRWYEKVGSLWQRANAIKECLPREVLCVIKTVNKLTNAFASNGAVSEKPAVSKDEVFIPSYRELEFRDNYCPSDFKKEGSAYPLYEDYGNLLRVGVKELHIRTPYEDATHFYTAWIVQSGLMRNSHASSSDGKKEYGLMVMFCV